MVPPGRRDRRRDEDAAAVRPAVRSVVVCRGAPTERSHHTHEEALLVTTKRSGAEAACDWTIPDADISSPLTSSKGVPIPLFNLVYHDAIITPYSPTELRTRSATGRTVTVDWDTN